MRRALVVFWSAPECWIPWSVELRAGNLGDQQWLRSLRRSRLRLKWESASQARGVMVEDEFKRQFETFKELSEAAGNRLAAAWEDRYPCLDDNTPGTGFDRHYIYHCAWAARVLARSRPT